MGTIKVRKSKEGRVVGYQATVRLKELNRPEYASFERITDARKWIQQIESSIREGRHFKVSEAKRRTLNELLDRYKPHSFPKRKSTRTPTRTLAYWRDVAGHLSLDRIAPAFLREHLDIIAKTPSERGGKPRSLRTVHAYLETLSAAFTMAVKEYQWMDENPCRKIKREKLNNRRERFLESDELKRLLEAVAASSNDYLHPAVLLSLATGGRYSEILGLKWIDVDDEHKAITFHDTKNGETRTVPVSQTAWDALQAHRASRSTQSEYVFPIRKPRIFGGRAKVSKPFEDLTIPFARALRKANIQGFRWHDLRHQAASMLVSTGATLAYIGEILGHKSPKMTARYSYLIKGHARGPIERADVLLREACESARP